MTMSTKDWLQLILLGGVWGAAYFFVEIALRGFDVLPLVTARVVLAALALWAFVFIRREPVPGSLKVWSAFLVMGVLNNIVPFTLLSWGQIEITSSLAAILTATSPMFAIVVAGVLLRDEPATPAKVLGVLVGFAGVIVMIGPEILGEIGRALWAQVAVLGAALSYAFASAYGKRFAAWGVSPVAASTGQVSMSALAMVIGLFATGQWNGFSQADAEAWAAVASLAILCTSFAYLLFFRLLATAGATNVLLVTFLIPVSTIILGVFILGEHVRAIEFAGMALIALGLVIIDGRVWRRFARRA